MLSRISHSRSTRWGGKWIAMLTVSTIQPRRSLMVYQLHSPLRIFLMETGLQRDGGLSAVKGQNKWSIARSMVLRMRQVLGACPSNKISSIKISTYLRGLIVVESNWSRVLGSWTSTPGAGASDRLTRFGKGSSTAIWSRRWSGC